MASADFSQFVVTTDRAPSVRPHGISPEPFPVYSSDLRIEVTVAFWTLMLFAILSAQYALISDFCPSSHGFAIASSRLYLTVQTLQVTLRFVGNYAPQDFHLRFRTCPSYKEKRYRKNPITLFLTDYIPDLYFNITGCPPSRDTSRGEITCLPQPSPTLCPACRNCSKDRSRFLPLA